MATIKLKNGSGAPLATDLVQGEPALDLTNKRLYTEDTLGAVIEVGVNPTELNVTGNITVGGTVDGRDVATDGTKLDGIEDSADVTDTANVTAAGALMDSEVTNLAQVKAFDSADYATAAQGFTADSALQNVVEDTTPQLGGTLVLNNNDITGTGNINNTGTVTTDGLTVEGSSGSTLNNVNFLNTDSSNTATANRIGLGITNSVGPVYTYIEANEDVTDGRPSLNFYTGDTATKRLRITDGGDVEFYEDNGSTAKLTWDASDESLKFADNAKATFGAGSDLEIYHSGTHSIINETGTGELKIQATNLRLQSASGGENYLTADLNGAVRVYYDDAQKFQTTSTGIDVTGNTESDTVTIGTSSVAGSEKLRVNGTVLTLGGSVSAPAIGVGDTNTGVYAPTAGQLGWTVNGQQRLFLDSTGIDVTGSVTADDVSLNTKAVIGGATPRIELFESDTTDVNTRIRNTGGELQIQSTDDSGTTSKSRIVIDHATGDISFREDTGSTAKLYWDASEESLGIGTTSPAEALHVAGNIRFGDTAPSELYTNSSELRLGVDKNNDNDTSNITFYANDSEKVRIDKDGHLIVPNGVTLGVAVDAYAAAKTLDDYEEGTFIPVIADASSGGNTGTATTAEGFYTKIGRQVVVVIKIEDIDTTGMTGANNIFIRGLPFVSASGAAGQSQGSLRLDRADLDANCCGIVCSSTSNSSYLTLRQTVDNSADVQIKVQDFTSGSADLFATITYFV